MERINVANGSTEAAVVSDLAERAQEPHPVEPGTVETYIVPEGHGVHVLDHEPLLPEPRRTKGTYRLHELDDLLDYANIHRDDHDTTTWIDRDKRLVTVVFNDASEAHAGWKDHRAELRLKPTPEWEAWTGQDGTWLSQEDFAEFVQEAGTEFVSPDAATMLEIAQTFSGKTGVEWKQGTRLDNGEIQLAYVENVQASAGRNGDLEIPSTLNLQIAVFEGEAPVDVKAALRYKIKNGVIQLLIKLDHPERVEKAVLDALESSLKGNGFDRVFKGEAPSV